MRSLSTLIGMALAAVLAVTACTPGTTGTASRTGSSARPSVGNRSSSPSESGTSASPSGSGGTEAGGGAANPACSGGDVATALAAAAAAQAEAESYRVTGSVTVGGTEQQVTLEFAKPDKVHVVLGPIEYVAIGSDTWQSTAGTWRRAPGVDLSTLTAGMGQLNEEIVHSATFTNASVDANATADGRPAVLYRYHESIPSELEADSQFWLDPASCRPIRNVATSTASGTSSTFEATYSDWGNVTIEPPA
jgi:hypothetical protein